MRIARLSVSYSTVAYQPCFRVGTLNDGTLKGRAQEVVKTESRRGIDGCCLQEIRWRGASEHWLEKTPGDKVFWKGSDTGHVDVMQCSKYFLSDGG